MNLLVYRIVSLSFASVFFISSTRDSIKFRVDLSQLMLQLMCEEEKITQGEEEKISRIKGKKIFLIESIYLISNFVLRGKL